MLGSIRLVPIWGEFPSCEIILSLFKLALKLVHFLFHVAEHEIDGWIK